MRLPGACLFENAIRAPPAIPGYNPSDLHEDDEAEDGGEVPPVRLQKRTGEVLPARAREHREDGRGAVDQRGEPVSGGGSMLSRSLNCP